MPDYTKIAANAARSIKKAGRIVDISRPVRSVDQITGIPTPAAPVTGKLALVTLPAKQNKATDFDKVFEPETFAKQNVLYIIAAAHGASYEPDLLDTLSIDGATWEIRGVGVLNPAGVSLIYKLGAVKR